MSIFYQMVKFKSLKNHPKVACNLMRIDKIEIQNKSPQQNAG